MSKKSDFTVPPSGETCPLIDCPAGFAKHLAQILNSVVPHRDSLLEFLFCFLGDVSVIRGIEPYDWKLMCQERFHHLATTLSEYLV